MSPLYYSVTVIVKRKRAYGCGKERERISGFYISPEATCT
jgi:hypothetical protein